MTQGFQSAGGIPTVARSLAGGLREAGHEVVVFDLATSRSDTVSRRLSSPRSWRLNSVMNVCVDETQLVHVGANGVELEPLRYLPRKELTTQLDRFDVVQVVAGAPALGLAAARSRRPTVLQVATTVAWERSSQLSVTTRNLALWRTMMTRITSHLERLALRRADCVLVMNREMADFVAATCDTIVVTAPPDVDEDRFTPRAAGWDRGGHLLSVCRLNDPRKGLDRLVRAYAKARALSPDLPPLVLAGRGKLPATLATLVNDLDLTGHVQVRSDVTPEELPLLYRAASIYLQASHEEGFGISVLEAMASGVPVIATDTAGTRETVVHGDTGWLVEQTAEVAQDIATRVLAVRSAGGGQMALQARQRAVSMFSKGASLSRTLEVYRSVLAGRSDIQW
ncbi:glycosyltransferase [Aeromicrobium sp.]|uniref:glycosyltransferase family 4 protein n=1 Tax=Aeromicrobium sp. TaxID=1871063 RepID=UPI0019A0DB3F|nr:glycosyltransferase [Aeromicrobium sp.]MBC7632933.1 glycosyltransferase [Aeromicrobium sp.]